MFVTPAAAFMSQGSPLPRRRRPRATMLAVIILLAGAVLRLATLIVPHAFFPDEIFQYLEAAHRLAFGPGVVTWEYREHIRSWLVPLALAAPMWLGGAIAPNGGFYLLLPKLVLLAISLMTISAAGVIGRRLSALHALFAMLVVATWAEFVYFSTVALTEPLATCIFLAAAALLYRRERSTRCALVGAGALLALTCLVRFQYGPAVAAFALAVSIRRPHQMLWLVAGCLPLLGLSAFVDLLMGDAPFGWLFANVHQNIALGRSVRYGVEGPLFYPAALFTVWRFWLGPILLLAILGARRFPALLLAALTNFVIHDVIAHKEYRFLLLTTMLLVVLAGIGTAEAIRLVRRRSGRERWTNLSWIAAAGWVVASASVAVSGAVRQWWTQQAPQLAAFEAVRDTPSLCGVALFDVNWAGTGGYAYLHRAIPLMEYASSQRDAMLHDEPQFDAVVALANLAPPPGFTAKRCFTGNGGTTICVNTRPGKCATATSPAIVNRQLILHGM